MYCRRWFLSVFVLSTAFVNDASAATNADQNHNRCPVASDSHSQTPGRIRISDLPAGNHPYKAYACKGRSLQLVCCMENYVRINWNKQTVDRTTGQSHWVDATVWWERTLHDNNQTLMIGETASRDNGRFQCVGQGSMNNHTAEVEIDLTVRDCYGERLQAELFTPSQYEITTLQREVGENGSRIRCQAFFGNLTACGNDCRVEWMREIEPYQEPHPIGHDASERVYSEPPAVLYDAGYKETILHIRQTMQSDYSGQYVCVAETKGIGIMRFGKVRLQSSESYDTIKPMNVVLVAILGGFIFTSLLVFLLSWPKRLEIKLLLKQSSMPPLQREGLSYHAVLLSTSGNEFCDRIKAGLQTNNGLRKALSVFRFPDDVSPGTDMFKEFCDVITQTRCIIAIVDRPFLADSHTLFFLRASVRQVDVVYIFHDLDPEDDKEKERLGEAIKANLYGDKQIVWPRDQPETETETDLGDEHSEQHPYSVDKIWLQLHLAIPSRRRRFVENKAGDPETGHLCP